MNDEAFTLHIAPMEKRRGKFKDGNIPWNRGKTWDDMFDKETQERLREHLRKVAKLGNAGKGHPHPKPVIQMDEYGNRLHWYESSVAAGKKLGVHPRNIRAVCYGDRPRCGGFRWKFDEIFL